jgi:polyribonucleotide nucleotidyltransferase
MQLTTPRRFERLLGGKPFIIETGKLAGQANGAVTVRYGDTVALVTATMSPSPREGIDFFPLTVDYEERLYAAGKIPGSFFRREGRPSTEGVLAARLTDRPIRPLFPKGFRNDVQIIITVLSVDREHDPDVLGTVGASAALSISNIPFDGPVAAVRVGYVDGQYVVNPTFSQLKESSLDLVVAGTRDAIMMVEAGAKEVPEDLMLGAIEFGQQQNQLLIDLQDEMIREIGQPKLEFAAPRVRPEVRDEVAAAMEGRLEEILAAVKEERQTGLDQRREELKERFADIFGAEEISMALDEVVKQTVRQSILERGVRPDGRGPTDIRPISCEVGLLPRTHGSGLFTRGQTQVLNIATLGSIGEEQRLDTLSPEETKRFLHHYNFPPYSVGEARPIRAPGRREIGHGALAERALEPVVPPEEEFPYTIRLVSEVLSSNGSTSMASVCAGTLSLMDAGVPIKAPVAGIAMGLVMGEDGSYRVLTDIAGLEDALGDMDFKVAGTAAGITALQMDIKIKGITIDIMDQALRQAREARLFILDKIRETIPEPRRDLSQYAPRMFRIQIPPDKIGSVIGPGGRVIRSIIDETKCTIDIEDDGSVYIGSPDAAMAQKAIEIIEGLTRDVEVGQIYTGRITRIMSFGAFAEILPGKEGLIHISELADYRVPSVEDVVKVGDEVMVMVTEIDSLGRINLSRRAVLEGAEPGKVPERALEAGRERREGPPRRGGTGERGPRGGNGRRGGPERRNGPDRGPRRGPGGPGPGGPRRGPGGTDRGPLPPPRPPIWRP